MKYLKDRATITLYPIGRSVRATITLYPTGRPVRATTRQMLTASWGEPENAVANLRTSFCDKCTCVRREFNR